jgi:long-chain acyl-CoA synthetase
MPTFYDRFLECVAQWPENIALEIQGRDRTESYTYAQLRDMAQSIASWLSENGFASGTRVAILADNHPRWVAAYLGTIAAGSIAVPLDTALLPDQAAKLLKDSGASLLFADRKHLETAQQAARSLKVEVVITSSNKDADRASADQAKTVPPSNHQLYLDTIFGTSKPDFTPALASPDDIVALLYTSGTTADPKGVMLTHSNLLGEVEAVFGWADIGPKDALLGVLPMFHVLAQMANLLLPLVRGSRVVYLETLNTVELLRALRERRISALAVVPQFFYLIHERIFKEFAERGPIAKWALSALLGLNRGLRNFGIDAGPLLFRKLHRTFGDRMRYLVTGGSRFDPKIANDFYALGIDLLQAYGLTETAGAAFATPPEDNVIGSVGKALKGVEAKILDAKPQEDGGPPVGEILIRGAVVMKGYWNRPDATAAVLKDGWLHTGDLGYFDAGGNLFLTGRQKEVIVLSNGKNIYPEEVESHYLQSPFIKEICLIALESRPGDPSSDRLHAVIVPDFEFLKQQKVVNSKEAIRFDIESLSAKLPSTKRIGSYDIWPEALPRTTTRKVKRFEVEKRVKAQRNTTAPAKAVATRLSAQDSAWLQQAQVEEALKIIREHTRPNPAAVRPSDNLELDLGLDSMQRIELLVALEKAIGGDVEESRLGGIYTVRELVDAVLESAASGKTTPASETGLVGWKRVFQEETTDPEVLALIRPRPIAEHFWYAVSRLVQMSAYDRFPLDISGLEKLPSHGPYILCSNHQSFLDPVILGSLLPWPVFRNTFSVGTSEIFGSGFMRVLARWLRIVVVDPDVNLIPAMRAGAFGLKHGRVLILYPEGERTIDGTPKVFKKGAAILAIHMQVPLVPVAIEGFQYAWPRGKFFQKFARLGLEFGDPIHPPSESEASETAYDNLTADLRTRVTKMWTALRSTHNSKA